MMIKRLEDSIGRSFGAVKTVDDIAGKLVTLLPLKDKEKGSGKKSGYCHCSLMIGQKQFLLGFRLSDHHLANNPYEQTEELTEVFSPCVHVLCLSSRKPEVATGIKPSSVHDTTLTWNTEVPRLNEYGLGFNADAVVFTTLKSKITAFTNFLNKKGCYFDTAFVPADGDGDKHNDYSAARIVSDTISEHLIEPKTEEDVRKSENIPVDESKVDKRDGGSLFRYARLNGLFSGIASPEAVAEDLLTRTDIEIAAEIHPLGWADKKRGKATEIGTDWLLNARTAWFIRVPVTDFNKFGKSVAKQRGAYLRQLLETGKAKLGRYEGTEDFWVTETKNKKTEAKNKKDSVMEIIKDSEGNEIKLPRLRITDADYNWITPIVQKIKNNEQLILQLIVSYYVQLVQGGVNEQQARNLMQQLFGK
jgi:hypothetical protein